MRLRFNEAKATQAAGRLLQLRGGMDKGPVVRRIYALIREESEPGESSVWRRYIWEPQNYEAALLGEAPADELTGAEEDLIAEVVAEHGHKSRWELVRLTHDLPEWRDPEGSRIFSAQSEPSSHGAYRIH